VIEGIGRSQTNWTDYCWDPPLGVCKGHVVAKRAICGRGPLRSWAGTLTENDHQAACSWRATGNVFSPPISAVRHSQRPRQICRRSTPPVATTGNVVSLPCDRSAASTLARSKVANGASVAAQTYDVTLD
jgi:hypothetical protein